MTRGPAPLPPGPDGDTFAALLEDLACIKDRYVVTQLRWYRDHARWPMLLYRGSSVLVILLSVSVPLLATLPSTVPWRDLALAGFALLIAAVTGLSAFFQWHAAWQSYIQTQLSLERQLSAWEIAVVAAKHEPDPQERKRAVLDATRLLLDGATSAVAAETGGFFERAQPPRTEQR